MANFRIWRRSALSMEVLERGITLAKHPEANWSTSMEDVDPNKKDRVIEVAKAVTLGAQIQMPLQTKRGRGLNDGPKPVRVSELAIRAASSLNPTSSVTPVDIELALRRQGMEFVEPFAPGRPLVPFYGYDRRPRGMDYTVGRNTTNQVRADRIPFSTLDQVIQSYDISSTCFAAGTKIVTKSGLKPIEDIKEGDEVLTHMGRFRRVYKTEKTPGEHRPTYRLKASGLDEVVVTGNHPFMVARYTHTQTRKRVMRDLDWVEVQNLAPRGHDTNTWRYDALTLPMFRHGNSTVLNLSHILPSYRDKDGFLAAPRGGATKSPTQIPMGFELGRLFGWYVAEGSLSHDREVVFALAADETSEARQILDDASLLFRANGSIKPSSTGIGLVVRVSSSAMANLFKCGTATTKCLPEWVWNYGNEAFFRGLLEGWSRGDGCTSQLPGQAERTTAITTSETLAWQMRIVAISLGLKPSSLSQRQPQVSVIREHLVQSGVSYALSWRSEDAERTGTWSFEADSVIASAITDLVPTDSQGFVYNLEVEEDHSYVTTAGTAHNCIRHIINDLRSMPLKWRAIDGHLEDVSKAIKEAESFWLRPDGKRHWSTWLASLGWDVFAFDAGCLYRERNKAGKVISVKIVDGTSVAPLADYFGDIPTPPAPSHVQFIQGVPWDWLTTDELIYEPMWPYPRSLYGVAPIETVLMNANTDMRLQLFFLQFFTSGAVSEMIMEAPPDQSDPDALAEWQEIWDAWMDGNQAKRHGVRWVPFGSKPFPYKNIDQIDPKIAEYVMRRTVAAYGLVPQDLGILDNVNRSTSETQVDTQFRIGTLPNTIYFESLINAITQEDLQLPIQAEFDTGRESEDRLMEAQAMEIYVSIGAISPDEVREDVLGKKVDADSRVPRFIDSAKLGPIPLKFIEMYSGKVDPMTLAPEGVKPDSDEFVPAFGLHENVSPEAQPSHGNSSIIPGIGDLRQQAMDASQAKDTKRPRTADNAPDRKKPGPSTSARASKQADLANWRRQSRDRIKAGKNPREFEDSAIDAETYDRIWKSLQVAGSLDEVDAAFGKAADSLHAAGIALRAKDSGRILMIQRKHSEENHANAGHWEFPGGRLENGEDPRDAAVREWEEEVGLQLPDCKRVGQWDTTNGAYRGFVLEVPSESDVELDERDLEGDPDGDEFESVAWWSPEDLNNSVMRGEIQAEAENIKNAIVGTTDTRKIAAEVAKILAPELSALRQPDIHVNVEAAAPSPVQVNFPEQTIKGPDVHVAAPVVNVASSVIPAPDVRLEPTFKVEAPNVTVEAPTVNVEAPNVTVKVPKPKARKSRTVAHKDEDGKIIIEREEEE